MEFVLGDVAGWNGGVSCTPTALAAISGESLERIGGLLQEAAKLHGRAISTELRHDYDLNDWLGVIRLLGGNWAPAEDYSESPFESRPTIDEWAKAATAPDPELVFCEDGATGHVF